MNDRLLGWVLRLMLLGSWGFMVLSLINDYAAGGNRWKQGDWLINSVEGPIRRGPYGSALIHVADWFNLSPVTVVIALQFVLMTVLYVVFWRVLAGLAEIRLAALALISPAMFLLIWMANIQLGAMRKELIGMAALALMLLWLRDRAAWALIGSVLILGTGVWAHEITVLFVPTFIWLAWLSWRTNEAGRWLLSVLTALVVLSTAAASVYTLVYARVDNWWQVCDPLVARDVAESLCRGAIKWVDKDGAHTLADVQRRNVNADGFGDLALSLAVSLAPLAYLTWLLAERWKAALGVVAALPFLPLFVVVVDWGRWISCGVFGFLAVLLGYAMIGELNLRRRPNATVVWALLAVGLLVVPYHVLGVVWGGVFTEVLPELRELADR